MYRKGTVSKTGGGNRNPQRKRCFQPLAFPQRLGLPRLACGKAIAYAISKRTYGLPLNKASYYRTACFFDVYEAL